MFLKRAKNKELEILGSGNEGEMPISNNELYYKSPYGCLDKEANRYKFDGQELCGFVFNISEVRSGISDYLKNKRLYLKMAKTKSKNMALENKFLVRLIYELL